MLCVYTCLILVRRVRQVTIQVSCLLNIENVMGRSMYPVLWGSEIFLSGGSKCEICVPLEVSSYVRSAHRVGGAFDPEFHRR